MREYQIMYWQDVPAQVRVFDGRKPISKVMPERFQKKRIETASVKFDVLVGFTSRYQHWKLNVSPTMTAPNCGRFVRSTGMLMTPLGPEF